MKNSRRVQWSIVVTALLLNFSMHADTTAGPAVFAIDAGAGAGANLAVSNAAAIVDGHLISLEDVRLKCLREYREEFLQRLIPDYILDRECKRRGVIVPELEIDRRIAELRTNLVPVTLEDKLKENHITMAGARDDIRREIEKPMLVADQVKPLHMVHCQELVVAVGSSRSESDALAMATDFRRQILAGADFATMVAQHSDGGTAEHNGEEKNGDMGVLYERIMRPVEAPVLDAALALKTAEVSRPVKATDGYHLVKALSTDDHHSSSEDALYVDAAGASRREQIGFLVPQTLTALMKNSKITFADDSDLAVGKPMPEAAAVIDGHPIPMQDVLDKCMAAYGPRVTDVLVQNYLVDRECAERGIAVRESEIDERVEVLRKQCAPMTLEDGMKMHHTTMEGLRYDFRQDIERAKLAIDEVQPIHMVHTRIIIVKENLVSDSDADRAASAAKLQIAAIQSQLNAGKSFEDLAMQHCVPDDPGKSGDMGIIYSYKPGIDTDIANAAGVMKKGEISSQPIRTYNGYALLEAVSDSENHPGDEDAAYARAQDNYRSQVARQRIRQIIVSLIKKSNVVYYVHA
jgi:parvulin-like peptidyl-prolyl isomerase